MSHCSVPYMVQSGVNYLEPVRRETEVLDIWDFRNLVLWAAQGGRNSLFSGLFSCVQGKHLVIGNVGDSRAVLGTKNDKGAYVAIQLTVDLKPNLPRKLVIYIPAQILERVHIMKFFLNSLVKVCYVLSVSQKDAD